MSFTSQQNKALLQAFEKARTLSLGTDRLADLQVGAASPQTEFTSKTHDIQLGFDYNKNPEAVPPEDESKIRFIMQVIQNQATTQLANAGKDFSKDSEAWINFFVNYPLLFNFQQRESRKHDENQFSLSVNTDLVEALIDPKAPMDIKSAFIKALKNAGGEVIATTQKRDNLEYLALIRSYDKASTLTIYRAELKTKTSQVKILCGGTKKIDLHIVYDRIVFEINNQLAIAIYPELSKQAVDIASRYLQQFFSQFAEEEFKRFDDWIKGLGR